MQKTIIALVGSSLLAIGCASTPPPSASGLTFKEAQNNVTLYDNKSPFEDAKKVGLASINLRFMGAMKKTTEKRGTGNAVTWAVLENVDNQLFQEIADEYYSRLAAKLAAQGLTVSDDWKNSKHYQTLVEDNAKHKRVTFDKDWGVSELVTANKAPYIEYGSMAFGAHAKLGNEQEYPVGQMFLTINFADIAQSVSESSSFSYRTIEAESTITPLVSVSPPTMGGISRAFAAGKGDGSYATFQGDSWGNTSVAVKNPLTSSLQYSQGIEKAEGMPEMFRKYSSFSEDLLSIVSLGRFDSGRGGAGEFVFVVKADREKYKAAVLDALSKWDDHLLMMIASTK